VGLSGRAIRNDFIDSIQSGRKKPFKCHYHCISSCNCTDSPYLHSHGTGQRQEKKTQGCGSAVAGKNAYRVNQIVSVRELIESLEEEFDGALKSA